MLRMGRSGRLHGGHRGFVWLFPSSDRPGGCHLADRVGREVLRGGSRRRSGWSSHLAEGEDFSFLDASGALLQLTYMTDAPSSSESRSHPRPLLQTH